MRLLTLGSFRRQVVVDRRSRFVSIERRLLWLFKSTRLIPFRHIHRIDYDYERTTTSIRGSRHGAGSGDEVESFRVALVLRAREDLPESHRHLEEEHVHLFSFHGEGQGQLTTFVDFQGQQAELSRRYVERLRELIGVGFGHELPQLHDDRGRAWTCQGCGRPGPPRAGRCYYCGGALAASTKE